MSYPFVHPMNATEKIDTRLCYVEPGKESSVAHAVGGKYTIEQCGPMQLCNQLVERFDYTKPGGSYTQLWYCGPDWGKLLVFVVGLIVVIFIIVIIVKAIKRRKQRLMGGGSDMLPPPQNFNRFGRRY